MSGQQPYGKSDNADRRPATAEQLETLRLLGVRVTTQITRSMAEMSIGFHHATARQLACLKGMGYDIVEPITKAEASRLIGLRRDGPGLPGAGRCGDQ